MPDNFEIQVPIPPQLKPNEIEHLLTVLNDTVASRADQVTSDHLRMALANVARPINNLINTSGGQRITKSPHFEKIGDVLTQTQDHLNAVRDRLGIKDEQAEKDAAARADLAWEVEISRLVSRIREQAATVPDHIHANHDGEALNAAARLEGLCRDLRNKINAQPPPF